jgi:Golgi nucleoside diphosphatase
MYFLINPANDQSVQFGISEECYQMTSFGIKEMNALHLACCLHQWVWKQIWSYSQATSTFEPRTGTPAITCHIYFSYEVPAFCFELRKPSHFF